jgi:CRISPR/Cas system-associated exonuclease Cas4 (RecB family)
MSSTFEKPALKTQTQIMSAESQTFAQERTTSARQVIRASELAQYSYCAKAWWLSTVLGKGSSNTREMQSGTVAHQQHGRNVWLSSVLRIAAIILVIVAGLVLLMALR